MSRMIFAFFVLSIKLTAASERQCYLQENCKDCLAADFNCSWCTDISYNSTARCLRGEKLLETGCSADSVLHNDVELTYIMNELAKDFDALRPVAIQMQPQKLRIKIVKSKPMQFKMVYRLAKNRPLDLYYLMDLTWSMRDDKETLVEIGENLGPALRTLTENYRLGYGSFADKPTMPMVVPGFEKNPCRMEKAVCEPTYGFQHHLSLTNNITHFVKKVNESKVTGNLDNLEGGLDALMQVLVCTERIGWRNEARKIVILASDGLLHFAGDGVLAGIVKKNDKRCHLNTRGEYTGTLMYDYPSLEEIYRELLKKKINVIFAITNKVSDEYKEIQALIPDVASVEILTYNSSNILDLVKKGYHSFVKKVSLSENSPPYMDISFRTNCGGKFKTDKQQNSCDNVEYGKEIEFQVTIKLLEWPNDDQYNHTIRIETTGISEYLEIELEIQKPCPCNDDTPSKSEKNEQCSYQGRFHCGMCFCDEGWIGRRCQCQSANYSSIQTLKDKCRPKGSNLGQLEVCSNHGECECGECKCDTGFTGKYCECSECGNCSENSDCVCGECVCKDGWSGSQCSCFESPEKCRSPTGDICSNHGNCGCGICVCQKSYRGTFCEESSSGNHLCLFYEDCVKCLIEQQLGIKKCENLTNICANNAGMKFKYSFTEEAFDDEIRCVIPLAKRDGENCRHEFVYSSDSEGVDDIVIWIDECLPYNYAALGLGIFVLTVIIGLVIIIVSKVSVYIHDKREYAKFEKERAGASLQENPIFKSPVTTYTVPISASDEESF